MAKLADWYRRFRGESKHLPGSGGQGAAMAQTKLAPLEAAIAVATGSWGGTVEDFDHWLRADQLPSCQSCGVQLSRKGRGHSASCELYAQAREVLNGRDDLERMRLEAEAKKLQEKLERNAQKLSRTKQ